MTSQLVKAIAVGLLATGCGVEPALSVRTEPSGRSGDQPAMSAAPSTTRFADCPNDDRGIMNSPQMLAAYSSVFRNAVRVTVDVVTPVQHPDLHPAPDLPPREPEASVALTATVTESYEGDLKVGDHALFYVLRFEKNRYRAGDDLLILGRRFDGQTKQDLDVTELPIYGDFPPTEHPHVFSYIHLIDGDDTLQSPYGPDCPETTERWWKNGTPLKAAIADIEAAYAQAR